MNECLVSDAEFDAECAKIDLSRDTGNPRLDSWFRENFSPHTGMWVRKHPEQKRLHEIALFMQGKRKRA